MSTDEGQTPGTHAAVELITPEGWPRGVGYAHGTAARGRLISVAGQIGWDPVTHTLVSDDFAAQAAQAFLNVASVVRAAGAAPTDIVRMTWYITDRAAYLSAQKQISSTWRTHFGRHYPAIAVVVVSGLIEAGAKIEIEATAVAP